MITTMVLNRRLRCLAAGLPLRRLAGYSWHLAGYIRFIGLNAIAAAIGLTSIEKKDRKLIFLGLQRLCATIWRTHNDLIFDKN